VGVVALSHVSIRVTDVDRALAFYCGVLGFREMFRLNEAAPNDELLRLIYLRITDHNFVELHTRGEPRPPLGERPAGLDHFSLEIDDIEAFAEYLTSKGHPPDRPPRKGRDGTILCNVRDPDGNRVELQQLDPDSMQAQALARLAAGSAR
jgi:lactoylglutathione lyase